MRFRSSSGVATRSSSPRTSSAVWKRLGIAGWASSVSCSRCVLLHDFSTSSPTSFRERGCVRGARSCAATASGAACAGRFRTMTRGAGWLEERPSSCTTPSARESRQAFTWFPGVEDHLLRRGIGRVRQARGRALSLRCELCSTCSPPKATCIETVSRTPRSSRDQDGASTDVLDCRPRLPRGIGRRSDHRVGALSDSTTGRGHRLPQRVD